jgi:glycosyltransferase involved in cell wall biosynthesis
VPEIAVSVIVPTYNRAALLERTIPTYLQDGVAELILVDDCSTDSTREVALALAARYGRIRYLRSERNLKQTHAKNMGIDVARCELLYFGDDDSVLIPGSIARLVKTMRETGAAVVGACSLYMRSEADAADLEAFLAERPALTGPIVDSLRLRTHFNSAGESPVEAPFVHSAFLCRADIAKVERFDEAYIGNCYREETDFLVRVRGSGERVVYEPRAAQINLPRAAASGGAQGGGGFVTRKLLYAAQSARNNWHFLRKNRAALARAFGHDVHPAIRQAFFLLDLAKGIAEYPFQKAFGRGA